MKKNYLLSILILVVGMMFGNRSFAQVLQAVDDNATVIANTGNQVVVANVLANDLINGQPVSLSQVTLSPAQSNYLSLDANGAVTYQGWAPPGTYVLTYQICVQGQPNNCAAGIVYVYVICPVFDAPHVSAVVEPSCVNPTGYITVDNVPPNGMLMYSFNGATMMSATGNGSITISIPTNTSGLLQFDMFYMVGNCTSEHTTVTVQALDTFYYSTTGTYVDNNGNGYTDVGDTIVFHYHLDNNSCFPVTNIQVHAGQDLADGGPLAVLAVGASDHTTFTSTHLLTQADINSGFVNQTSYATGTSNGNSVGWQSSLYFTLTISNGIIMTAFIDSNGNGVRDGVEGTFMLGTYNYEINNDGVVHHINANQPQTIYESNPLNSYDLSFTVNSECAPYYSVSATYTDVTVANGSGQTTYWFPVTASPYNDLSVSLFYFQPPRPGFIYTNQLFYTNAGNQTIASGSVTFTKDNALTISNISQPGTVATANGFTYNFTNLLPNETRYITIQMPVPTIPTVALGQMVTNNAAVSIPPSDININNNTSVLTRAIVGSYDPNEKSETHGGKILVSDFDSSDYLTYTIWFENTGTADAINVRVNDLLDSQLDENSVRMVSASHQYTLDRVGNSLSWTFAGIDLPPSVPNTTTGHGYVIFQVKPKPGYAAGDIIPNAANIYFDSNPAIVTNNFTTEFVNSLKTDGFAFNHLRYSPNPVKNSLTISNNTAIENITVTSVLGQEMISKEINALNSEIDLSSIADGIYFVKATAQKQSKTFQIIKR